MSEQMSFTQVHQNLLECMKSTTLVNILKFVKERNPSLWGEQKPRSFVKQQVYFALFKLKTGMGFQKLKTHIRFPHHISLCSLEHNFAELLSLFKIWSKEQITLGTLGEWKTASRNLGEENKKICLHL